LFRFFPPPPLFGKAPPLSPDNVPLTPACAKGLFCFPWAPPPPGAAKSPFPVIGLNPFSHSFPPPFFGGGVFFPKLSPVLDRFLLSSFLVLIFSTLSCPDTFLFFRVATLSEPLPPPQIFFLFPYFSFFLDPNFPEEFRRFFSHLGLLFVHDFGSEGNPPPGGPIWSITFLFPLTFPLLCFFFFFFFGGCRAWIVNFRLF